MQARCEYFFAREARIFAFAKNRNTRSFTCAHYAHVPDCVRDACVAFRHAASISLLALLPFLLSQKPEILVYLTVRILRTTLTASGIGRAATAVAGTQWRQWSGSGTLDSPTPRQRGDAHIIVENHIFLYYRRKLFLRTLWKN